MRTRTREPHLDPTAILMHVQQLTKRLRFSIILKTSSTSLACLRSASLFRCRLRLKSSIWALVEWKFCRYWRFEASSLESTDRNCSASGSHPTHCSLMSAQAACSTKKIFSMFAHLFEKSYLALRTELQSRPNVSMLDVSACLSLSIEAAVGFRAPILSRNLATLS